MVWCPWWPPPMFFVFFKNMIKIKNHEKFSPDLLHGQILRIMYYIISYVCANILGHKAVSDSDPSWHKLSNKISADKFLLFYDKLHYVAYPTLSYNVACLVAMFHFTRVLFWNILTIQVKLDNDNCPTIMKSSTLDSVTPFLLNHWSGYLIKPLTWLLITIQDIYSNSWQMQRTLSRPLSLSDWTTVKRSSQESLAGGSRTFRAVLPGSWCKCEIHSVFIALSPSLVWDWLENK